MWPESMTLPDLTLSMIISALFNAVAPVPIQTVFTLGPRHAPYCPHPPSTSPTGNKPWPLATFHRLPSSVGPPNSKIPQVPFSCPPPFSFHKPFLGDLTQVHGCNHHPASSAWTFSHASASHWTSPRGYLPSLPNSASPRLTAAPSGLSCLHLRAPPPLFFRRQVKIMTHSKCPVSHQILELPPPLGFFMTHILTPHFCCLSSTPH